MANKQDEQIKKNLDIFLRRRKLITSCLLVSIVAGLGLYLLTPKKYQSIAMIKYQRQSINPTSMSPDIQARINEVVSTLTQQITSRTSLEELITRFGLYKKSLDKLPMEDVVDLMRENTINVKPMKPGDIFTVSFQGNDPKKVMQVTNALAAKFIEENIRYREERVTENSAYIKEELAMAKKSLDKKDAVMRDYKLKYYNEMPQQLPSNMDRVNALQAQYQDNQSNIQNLEQTRVMIQEQISLRKQVMARMMPQSPSSLAESDVIYQSQDTVADLAKMKLDLDVLRSKYTENHPEVKRLKKLIQQREDMLLKQSTVRDKNSPNVDAQAPISDTQYQQLESQLHEIEYSLANLKKEKGTIQKEIIKYKQWVDAAPVREAEWSSLTRDYDQLNKHYESLVAQNLAAESAESLERSQRGSQFKIIDPAHFPEKPFKPDFIKIMLIALSLGLACSAGISYYLEILDTSFKDPSDIELYLGIPVACSIPIIYTDKERRREKIQSIMWTLSFVIPTIALGVGIVYLAQMGLIII